MLTWCESVEGYFLEAEEEEEEEEAEKSERTEPDEEDPILRVKKELLPPNAGLSNDGDDHKKS